MATKNVSLIQSPWHLSVEPLQHFIVSSHHSTNRFNFHVATFVSWTDESRSSWCASPAFQRWPQSIRNASTHHSAIIHSINLQLIKVGRVNETPLCASLMECIFVADSNVVHCTANRRWKLLRNTELSAKTRYVSVDIFRVSSQSASERTINNLAAVLHHRRPFHRPKKVKKLQYD